MKNTLLSLLIILILGFMGFFIYDRSIRNIDADIDISESAVEDKGYKRAMFAGGCFWCVEAAYDEEAGILKAVSGYSGGDTPDPTYQDHGDHREVVQIIYDPEKTDYATLVDIYFRQIDPTDDGGQFADRGHSYTTAIYYYDGEQQKIAEDYIDDLEDSGKFKEPIVVPVLEAKEFYLAEEYHQDYHSKNPVRYKYYKKGSGRTDYIKETWGTES